MEIGLGLPPASTRFDLRISYGRPTAKKSNNLTKARSSASNQHSQSEAVTLKDVFFSDNPKCKKVQRRCEREYCCNKELVACGIQFRASSESKDSSSDDDYSNSCTVDNSSLTSIALNNTRVHKRPRLGSPYSTSNSLAHVSCPSNAQENAISGTAKGSCDEKLIPCPLCNRVFLSSVIQIHANNFMDVMNSIESKVYDDLMFETEPSIEKEDREPD